MKKISTIYFYLFFIFIILVLGYKLKIDIFKDIEKTPNSVIIDSKNEEFDNEIRIGNQIWSSKNLDVSTFRNGDPIYHAKSKIDWYNAGHNQEPAWCYYENNSNNNSKYGKLYNWYAIHDERGLAPKGWHVPTSTEIDRLSEYLGGDYKAGKKMKSKSGWDEDGNGTNETGFSGLPGGMRYYDGDYYGEGFIGNWWSSTSKYEEEGKMFALYWSKDEIGPNKRYRSIDSKSQGKSIRCIKDY